MSEWTRDLEAAALHYLTGGTIDPQGARQIVDGLLAKGAAQRDPMPAARAVIADFPFDAYGIDLDGVDPAWVGDLASAIAGALGGGEPR